MRPTKTLICVLLFFLPLFGQSNPAPAKPVAKKTTTSSAQKPDMAVWEKWMEEKWRGESLDISETEFTKAGLNKLTKQDLSELFRVMLVTKEKSATFAVNFFKSRNVVSECYPEKPNYDKVRIYMADTSTNNAEIMSKLRQKLRAISDVEIVFNDSDADLGVGMIAEQEKSTTGNHLGYSISTVTYTPCRQMLGDKTFADKSLEQHYLHAAATVEMVVDMLAARLDNDFETIRKSHAAAKARDAAQNKK